ncbi:MAG TPA: amidohydrolase family protein [Candidatus Binatia bacterium]|nr:amidohydrolase family protein [Candidatus Binatia bacterium]
MGICAIDIHHHYVPTSLLDEAKNHGKALGVELKENRGEKSLSFAGGPPFVLHPELPAVEERLKMMQESKLAIAALEAHTATLGYRLSSDQGESWCRLYNEGIKELVARHPDRFVGIASVPLQDPIRAAKVLEHAVRDLKLCGGYIGTNVNGQYYNSSDFDPFWKKAEELDALIVMHPEDVAGADRMNPYGLKLICGNPADSALCLGYMTYSGVFDRVPNLKLCVLHGGGFFPYHLGRFDQGWYVRYGARAAQAKKPPSAYLENLYYDNMIYRVDTIDYLRKLAGADHIMVGTDYPYTLGDWKAVEKIEALDCPDSEKELMLEGNAKRLLKI